MFLTRYGEFLTLSPSHLPSLRAQGCGVTAVDGGRGRGRGRRARGANVIIDKDAEEEKRRRRGGGGGGGRGSKEEENYKDKDDLFNPFKATAMNGVVVEDTAKYDEQNMNEIRRFMSWMPRCPSYTRVYEFFVYRWGACSFGISCLWSIVSAKLSLSLSLARALSRSLSLAPSLSRARCLSTILHLATSYRDLTASSTRP